MANKIYSYYVSYSYFDIKLNKNISILTQLYLIGIYIIINNNPSEQYNLNPKDLVKIDKDINNNEKKNLIKDLIKGRKINVIETDNGYEEIK